jgi:hypothetical protein
MSERQRLGNPGSARRVGACHPTRREPCRAPESGTSSPRRAGSRDLAPAARPNRARRGSAAVARDPHNDAQASRFAGPRPRPYAILGHHLPAASAADIGRSVTAARARHVTTASQSFHTAVTPSPCRPVHGSATCPAAPQGAHHTTPKSKRVLHCPRRSDGGAGSSSTPHLPSALPASVNVAASTAVAANAGGPTSPAITSRPHPPSIRARPPQTRRVHPSVVSKRRLTG